ncbi:pleckstrin homology domain-containing family S member 1-like [Stegostoma tigrinum]|uniref:pleckstrin homology domain-containing family S member 1-like n=1 Tax=Stegostoma tigrinum TaxID=3053191 RepID=UPI00202AD252|nr:pleckstrin homology domain-containing family S member 1-like [Stegostoma tigrinum]XP_059509023.1 pleckstrin homology domain-containing family S member 1-like [Stegostoma tigrinum]XP_059509024.1 pleckstrin homology domain-containing family S member 1-like [Stegostoma tigrinum]XP_059509025.1 pleckstrin homology domain-containing family S member 1-like [Stegostoma tigrinum]
MKYLKMSKQGTGSHLSAVFYDAENVIGKNDICFEGYLTKSPPTKRIGIQTSWKKRYFVLTAKDNEHILYYFKNQEQYRKSPPHGKIHIEKIVELCNNLDDHPKWAMIQKLFKCTSETVVLLKTEERDYFLIGEKDTAQLLQGIIANLLHMKTISTAEEQAQGSSEKYAKTEWHSQRGTLSRGTSDPMYDTILENDQGKTKWINPNPHVESASSEMDKSIHATPKMAFKRFSQPVHSPVNIEKPRSLSLPSQFEDPSNIYDTPRNVLAVMRQWKNERPESGDSGIYMPMASIRSRTSTNSTFDCSEQIDEEETISNLTNNVTEEQKLEKLDVIVHRNDFKNNMSIHQAHQKVCVMSSDKKCPLKLGDQILAINKLQINGVEEVSMFVDKLMEDKMIVTILRLFEAPQHDRY